METYTILAGLTSLKPWVLPVSFLALFVVLFMFFYLVHDKLEAWLEGPITRFKSIVFIISLGGLMSCAAYLTGGYWWGAYALLFIIAGAWLWRALPELYDSSSEVEVLAADQKSTCNRKGKVS